jgi:hypothetical protein
MKNWGRVTIITKILDANVKKHITIPIEFTLFEDNIKNVILGAPFMNRNKIVIDMNNKLLYFPKEQHVIKIGDIPDKFEHQQIALISAIKETTLSPNSYNNIPCEVKVVSGKRKFDELQLVEPIDYSGLYSKKDLK